MSDHEGTHFGLVPVKIEPHDSGKWYNESQINIYTSLSSPSPLFDAQYLRVSSIHLPTGLSAAPRELESPHTYAKERKRKTNDEYWRTVLADSHIRVRRGIRRALRRK
jgi:hypothetical protein